ncbi:MAG: hypothetical protein WHT65_01800 [Pseudothermotoga sp.]
MKFIKAIVFIVMIFYLLYACVIHEPTDLPDDLRIRYIAIMYKYGPFLETQRIEALMEQDTYDDDVLAYYRYFKGLIELSDVKIVERAEIYDPRIKDYIKQHLPSNHSDDILFLDNFDESLPVTIKTQDSEKNEELARRIYDLLMRDWQKKGLFRVWYEEFYPDQLSEGQMRRYAELLAQVSCSYSSTIVERVHATSSNFYRSSVDLSKIPPELLLAIAYKESRLFPASFRAEISQDKIQAISWGLCHILIDADTLDLTYEDIGNQKIDMRTFELINFYYFNNGLSEIDLIQLKGNLLVSLIQLALIYEILE